MGPGIDGHERLDRQRRSPVTRGVTMGSDGRLKLASNSKRARKCSPLLSLKYRLTQRPVQMLAALARQRALTRDQLTGLFFGSKRRCQAALSQLKRLGLVRHVIYLPQPLAGSGPRAYLLTAAGAGVAAQVTGINRKVLGLRTARTGRSFLHINHTLAINDFYVGLHVAIRQIHGGLVWVDEDGVRSYYSHNGKPTLTPDGAAEIRAEQKNVRAFIEIDRGTERRLWLRAKFQRYLRHLAGRVGADRFHVLFVVPDATRETTVRQVAAFAFRWAPRPTPGVWTTTNVLLAAHGPLGPVWARVLGSGERLPLLEIGSADAARQLAVATAEQALEEEEVRQAE
jgi:protein involved in plasmid replication-relaxation